MKKAFVVSVDNNEEILEAVIITEDKKSYTVPLEMLPKNIQVDDFIILDNGNITIDPDNDKILAAMQCELNEQI